MDFEEILFLFVGGTLVLSSSFVSMKLYFKRNSKLLSFFSLSWLSMAMYLILTAVSAIFESPLLFKINDSVVVTSSLVFFLMFLDYAQNDTLSPKKTSLSTVFFAVVFVWNWYPSNVHSYVNGNIIVPFYDIYVQIQNLYIASLSFSIAYWQFLTARKTPESLKHLRKYLVTGGIFAIVAATTAFVSFIQEASAIMFISIIGMAFTSTIAIQKEPRLVHLLPFTVYRLIITSKGGCLYYSKEWSKIDIDSVMIAGMMSAVNTFSKGALKERDEAKSVDLSNISSSKFDAGVVSEIKLQKAVMLSEMKFTPVNILLLSSKSSKDLKTSLEDFSQSFVQTFKDNLYTRDGFPIEVSSAEIFTVFEESKIEPLVNKYFSNIPSFL